MKQTSRTTKATTHRPLSQADLAILGAVQRLHYLTAAQVSRLLYPRCHDGNRYARRRLARLIEAKLLLRLTSLPAPRHGSAPYVFTWDGPAGNFWPPPAATFARVRSRPRPAITCSWTTPWPPLTC